MKLLITLLVSLTIFGSDFTPKNFSSPIYETNKNYDFELNKNKVVINFWATWCTSCIEELPLLESLKNSKNANGYDFIGISVGDSDKKIKKFKSKYGYPYKIVKDETKTIAKRWNVQSLPVTIILENGKIIYEGVRPPKEL